MWWHFNNGKKMLFNKRKKFFWCELKNKNKCYQNKLYQNSIDRVERPFAYEFYFLYVEKLVC